MDESGARQVSRSQPQPGTVGAPADRISSLSDDLLLQVLAHLGYAAAAARTALLSRRWRDLFSRLPSVDVTVCNVPPGMLEDTLRRAARPGVRLLDIAVHAQERPATISSALREAARLSPAQLRLTVPSKLKISHVDWHVAVDLPCFLRATAIDLCTPPHLPLAHSLSSTGFPLLESLSLSDCDIDLENLLPRCPRLRVLTMVSRGELTVQSFSLQELVVKGSDDTRTRRIAVEAPMLQRLTMSFHANLELSVSVLAPTVEKVSWRCSYSRLAHGLGVWDLLEVSLETTQGTRHRASTFSNTDDTTGGVCSKPPRINVLTLRMSTATGSFGFPDGDIRFAAEISKHMVTDLSGLELHLTTKGHAFGSLVWRLLGMHHIGKATRSIRILLLRSEVRVACQANCPCGRPWNWRTTQPEFLPNLKSLEIEGFEGEDHEFDFLKLALRCAPMITRVTIRLIDQVTLTPNDDWCTRLYNIFAEYPSVEGNVELVPDN